MKGGGLAFGVPFWTLTPKRTSFGHLRDPPLRLEGLGQNPRVSSTKPSRNPCVEPPSTMGQSLRKDSLQSQVIESLPN